MGAMIRLDQRHARAYVAEPGDRPRGRVLLLHDASGLAPHVRFLCDDLADAGFVALAPDLFEHLSGDAVLSSEWQPDARAERLLASAMRGFDTLGRSDDGVAAVGFSAGAVLGLGLARRGAVDSLVLYDVAPTDDDVTTLAGQLLVHLSQRGDPLPAPAGVPRDEQTPPDVTSYVYPGTDPRFANADGDTFDLDAADLAWQRTVRFLTEHLPAA